ncbi:E3 ubiquitin-protein ligase hel2 [Bienertia sinuspersici]
MDEGCCAVCAETLEWVAYGSCGHKDVCALCIARLRFICHDLHCCICKSFSSSVFITKALGSLTRVINDFSILPADAKDGKVGSFWFHEDTQAYFDDFDEYKIIKAMCKLSCSVCDQMEAEGKRNSKRRGKFKSIEQLKDHLSHQHDLYLCSLCLEYKKVFISEQKLFSRVQLRQHIRYGDSEVDGSKNERCGFSGHPFCEFCQIPYYGDNELYFHMSTEHYTCHICQRQQSTQYEYYKDYNDLEDHFRSGHFLCEEGTCLEKKFVVFPTEADLKRHSALEHGGNMCRSKRRTALQLNSCFHHREREEGHRIRPHNSFQHAPNLQLSSGSSANGERINYNLLHDASSITQAIPSHGGTREISATASNMSSSIQLQGPALDFRSVLLSGSEFPRLPGSSKRRRRKSRKKPEQASNNHTLTSSSSQPSSSDTGHVSHVNTSVSPQIGSSTVDNSASSSSLNFNNQQTPVSTTIANVGPSSSAPNLICSASNENTQKGCDIKGANKSLVERIYASLEFDKEKFATFKVFSKEYRDGVIDAGEYLAYVHQFGLTHLIFDLARLCPDPQKQKELLQIHKTNSRDVNESGLKKESSKSTANKHSKKGKEKCGDSGSCVEGVALPDSITNTLKELKLNSTAKAKAEKAESPLLKVVEHSKSKTPAAAELPAVPSAKSVIEDNNSSGAAATGGKKKMKKKSKFHKTRLGESSESGVPDLNCFDLASDFLTVSPNEDSILASVRGVWRNDGGRRLVAMSQSLPYR